MKSAFICLVVLSALFSVATAVSAAPTSQNPNTETIPVNCAGLGSFDVITTEHGVTAFGPDGVLVAKQFTGEATFTITVDSTVFGPFSDSEDETHGLRHGYGYQERLVPCSFEQSFTDHFTLDAETAEFFGIPEQYVGSEATFTGTFEGTAWVLSPGN